MFLHQLLNLSQCFLYTHLHFTFLLPNIASFLLTVLSWFNFLPEIYTQRHWHAHTLSVRSFLFNIYFLLFFLLNASITRYRIIHWTVHCVVIMKNSSIHLFISSKLSFHLGHFCNFYFSWVITVYLDILCVYLPFCSGFRFIILLESNF